MMKKLLLSMVLLLSGVNLLGNKMPQMQPQQPKPWENQGMRPDGLPYGHPTPYHPSMISKSPSPMFGPQQSQYQGLPKQSSPYPYEITPDRNPATWGGVR